VLNAVCPLLQVLDFYASLALMEKENEEWWRARGGPQQAGEALSGEGEYSQMLRISGAPRPRCQLVEH
jgi:hypothetical protein